MRRTRVIALLGGASDGAMHMVETSAEYPDQELRVTSPPQRPTLVGDGLDLPPTHLPSPGHETYWLVAGAHEATPDGEWCSVAVYAAAGMDISGGHGSQRLHALTKELQVEFKIARLRATS